MGGARPLTLSAWSDASLQPNWQTLHSESYFHLALVLFSISDLIQASSVRKTTASQRPLLKCLCPVKSAGPAFCRADYTHASDLERVGRVLKGRGAGEAFPAGLTWR